MKRAGFNNSFLTLTSSSNLIYELNTIRVKSYFQKTQAFSSQYRLYHYCM